MNILYLAHRIPFPPDKGDKIRSFRELTQLAKRHKVRCACFVDRAFDMRYVGALREICEDVRAVRIYNPVAKLRGLLGLCRGGTVTESFYESATMRRILGTWCQSVTFDAVVAFSSSMAPYALRVPAVRRVLDLCDLDSQKWLDYAKASSGSKRLLYATEGNRLAAQERDWIERFDATLLITAAEAAALGERIPARKVYVVTNGVELPPLEDARSAATTPSTRRPPTVGFVGVMDYRPNIDAVCWFVSECWPHIRAASREAVFRIVGRSPCRRVRKLSGVAGVEVVGAVDEVLPELRRFDVSVAPMRIARGLQNKVLEAMAAAIPVVASSQAAVGIGGDHRTDLVVADGPTATIEAVLGLMNDPVGRRRIGLAGRQAVESHHNWDAEMQRFELLTAGTTERSVALAYLGASAPGKTPRQMSAARV